MNFQLPQKFTPPSAIAGVSKDVPILVAFSGGADSTALLYMLATYYKINGGRIYAAHVNHMIRGEEADRDEQFCRSFAESLGVELFVCRCDVPKYARETSQSIETAARQVRYDFFDSVMQEHGIPLLATAHNANDNLETIIFNICRGCGLTGVSGIPLSRPCKHGTVVRPILSMSRAEILDFCRENSLDYVTDSTNTDTDYTRNKIRAQIIPALTEINSSAVENAARLSEALREDSACLESLSDWFFEEMNDDGSFELEKLLGSPSAVTSRAISSLYRAVSGGSTLESVHLSDIRELCRKGIPHSRINLPAGIDARIENSRLYISKHEEAPLPPNDFCVILKDGENFLSEINAKIIIGNSQSNINIYKKSILLYLDSDKICGVLRARNRMAGDKIRINGVNKQLKKLLTDLHIPLSLRYRLPVIVDDNGIVAVPFAAFRDGVESKNEQNCIKLQFNLN
ncbi:MAG: tRNA lysidine(34) synthetase TilS [Ruminococcaceae bacterium]|nr:tRNA lysidine(34) synthetase TilS [Oscillospiraceae bacterium]